MTILITGGTGKTGINIAKLLNESGRDVLLTSRKGVAPAPFKAVKFDWFDKDTFENPFAADSNIERVYLVIPPAVDMEQMMKPFIDLAIAKGVKGFVLLSGSRQTPETFTGRVHKLLQDAGVDYATLKPGWFQENFASNYYHSIRENNEIVSATGDGQVPFVSTHDIAQAAVEFLTAEHLGKQEVFLHGPELFSYDEAVKLLSSVIGREITHRRVSPDEMTKIYAGFVEEDLAKFIVGLEQGTAKGEDRQLFEDKTVNKIVGQRSLLQYFKDNKEIWIKA